MRKNLYCWFAVFSVLAVGLAACFVWAYQSIFTERGVTKLLYRKVNGGGKELKVEGIFDVRPEIWSLSRAKAPSGESELVVLRFTSESEIVEFRGKGLALLRGIDRNIQKVENLPTGGIEIMACTDVSERHSWYVIKVDISAGGLMVVYSDISYVNHPLGRIPDVVQQRSEKR